MTVIVEPRTLQQIMSLKVFGSKKKGSSGYSFLY